MLMVPNTFCNGIPMKPDVYAQDLIRYVASMSHAGIPRGRRV